MIGFEIATLLAAAGYGTVNTNVFYDDMPPDPDVAMVVLPYNSGQADEPNLGEGGTLTRYEFQKFQLCVRGAQRDAQGPQLVCIQARATLVTKINTTISGVRYIGIEALSPPSQLMVDETFRYYWICNFRAIKVPSTS